MTIAWTTVQKALQDWAVSGSGFSDQQVLWAPVPGDRPTEPYITLEIVALEESGLSGIRVEDSPAPTPGAEINLISASVYTGLLSIQCFGGTGPSVFPANVAGPTMPLAVLNNVRAAGYTDAQRTAFREAGLGLGEWNPIVPVSSLLNTTVIEPRAATTVGLHLSQEISVPGTFIGTAQLEGQGDLARGEFDVGAPLSPLAVAGDSEVTLTWNDVDGPMLFNLYRDTSANVTPEVGTLIPNVASGHVDTGLVNGTPYFYVVTAVHPTLGESPYSVEVSATPTP